MRLTPGENQELEAALANLKRCLEDELKQMPAISASKATVDPKLLADDKFLAKIKDAYLSSSDGVLGLLIDSGLLAGKDCLCVGVCTMSNR